VIATAVLFVIIKKSDFSTHSLSDNQLRAVIYLQVWVSIKATIFVMQTREWSYLNRPAYIVLATFVTAQIGATIIGVYGMHGYPHDGEADVRGAGWA